MNFYEYSLIKKEPQFQLHQRFESVLLDSLDLVVVSEKWEKWVPEYELWSPTEWKTLCFSPLWYLSHPEHTSYLSVLVSSWTVF